MVSSPLADPSKNPQLLPEEEPPTENEAAAEETGNLDIGIVQVTQKCWHQNSDPSQSKKLETVRNSIGSSGFRQVSENDPSNEPKEQQQQQRSKRTEEQQEERQQQEIQSTNVPISIAWE